MQDADGTKHLGREEIERYHALDEERKALDRRSAALKTEQDALKKRFLLVVLAKGGESRTYKRCGFVLAIKTGARFPKWKEEFLARLGADEVERVVQATSPVELLVVEPLP